MQLPVATPWSMTFSARVGPDVVVLIRELMNDPVAHDGRTFLFDSMTRASQIGLTAISMRAGQVPALTLYHLSHVIAMADGEWYQAKAHGWQRVRSATTTPISSRARS